MSSRACAGLVLPFCLLLILALPQAAEAQMEIPPNDGFVTDAAGLLSVEEDEALEAMLTQYRSQTSNEIAIVILQTVTGSSIAEVAVEIGKKWGVGSEKDNGILLLISYEDREMFLATGYGLEGAVPDIVSKGIIEEEIAPFFREAKYAEGLQAGIVALQKHIAGEYTADRYEGSSDTGGAMSWVFFFIFIFFNWIAASLARSKSWWAGGIAGAIFGLILVGLYGWWLSVPILAGLGFLFDYLFSTGKIGTGRRGGGSPWTGGFGGRGGGGGGFGGFGGGSFGGGGARGKW